MAHGTPDPADAEDAAERRLVGSDRVLAILAELAGHPEGIGLESMATAVNSPKPTVHRALASLRRAGFATQDDRGHYLLGDEFLRLAFTHHEARPDHLRVRPALQALAERFRETAHYAVLDGRCVVYRAKVDPPVGAVRLTSTIGGRNPVHCTAVGKLLLAQALPDEQAVRVWVAAGSLERRTERTMVTADALCRELDTVRAQGFAVDDQENEPGVNCLAIPVWLTSPRVPSGAISVSALTYRTPLRTLVDSLDEIRTLAGQQAP